MTHDVDDGPSRLPRPQYLAVLGASLIVFFAGVARTTWHPLQIWAPILWSYALLPVGAAALLAWGRRWSWLGFLLDTISLVAVKFAITYVAMTVVWAIGGPGRATPSSPELPAPARVVSRSVEGPAPTPIPRERLGRLAGVVVDPAGVPSAGVVVHVASGLDGLVFAPRVEPLVLVNGGRGPRPSPASLQVGQQLVLRSTGGLHTYRGETNDGRAAFNFPVLGGPDVRPRTVGRAVGWVRVRCTVHPDEPTGLLLVTDHPHAVRTDRDGRFSLEAVPPGRLVLEARDGLERSERWEVDLAPGGTLDGVELRLEPGDPLTDHAGSRAGAP